MDHPPIYTRMEVVFCASNIDTEGGDTSDAVGKRGATGCEPVIVCLFPIKKSAVTNDVNRDYKFEVIYVLTMQTQSTPTKNPSSPLP